MNSGKTGRTSENDDVPTQLVWRSKEDKREFIGCILKILEGDVSSIVLKLLLVEQTPMLAFEDV